MNKRRASEVKRIPLMQPSPPKGRIYSGPRPIMATRTKGTPRDARVRHRGASHTGYQARCYRCPVCNIRAPTSRQTRHPLVHKALRLINHRNFTKNLLPLACVPQSVRLPLTCVSRAARHLHALRLITREFLNSVPLVSHNRRKPSKLSVRARSILKLPA